MKRLPYLLILFRFLLAPVMIFIAYQWAKEGSIIIVILLFLGLISDVLDGIVARKAGVSSATIRRLDSQVDMVFWVSAGWCLWVLYPEIVTANRIPIIFIFVTEALCYIISLLRFGKETCTHAWLSKLWGITLLVAFTSLIGFGHAGIPFAMAMIMGVISHIDRILITLILPHWTHDVPSAYHAWLIRKGKDFKKHILLNS